MSKTIVKTNEKSAFGNHLSGRKVEYTETYTKIKSNSSNWPEWRVDSHNVNFTFSVHAQKIIIKK